MSNYYKNRWIGHRMNDTISFVSENGVSGQKLCSFLFPEAWSVPDVLKKCTPKEMSVVLDIAGEIWERVHSGAESVHMRDVVEMERKRIMDEWNMKMDVVEKRGRMEKERLEDTFAMEVGKLERRIADLQGQLVGSESSCSVLRQQYEGLKDAVSESFRSALETVKSSHNGEIERVRAEYKERMADMKVDVEREWSALRNEQEKLRKAASSVKKGALGEQGIREFIDGYTRWKIVEDSSKTAQAADCVVIIDGVECRFEVKNYSNVVPLKEVTKFVRDMQTHPESKVGVFLSLNTSISGKGGDSVLRVEWSPLGQIMIYIQKFCEQDPVAIASFLENCVGIYKYVDKMVRRDGNDGKDKGCHEDSNSVHEHYKGIMGQVGLYIEKELVRVGEMMLCAGHDKKNLYDLIQKQHANYVYQFGQLKSALETMVCLLSGKELKDTKDVVDMSEMNEGSVVEEELVVEKKKSMKKVSKEAVKGSDIKVEGTRNSIKDSIRTRRGSTKNIIDLS